MSLFPHCTIRVESSRVIPLGEKSIKRVLWDPVLGTSLPCNSHCLWNRGKMVTMTLLELQSLDTCQMCLLTSFRQLIQLFGRESEFEQVEYFPGWSVIILLCSAPLPWYREIGELGKCSWGQAREAWLWYRSIRSLGFAKQAWGTEWVHPVLWMVPVKMDHPL